MLNILIADDDFPVRMFLKQLIDWNKNGFEIVGEAMDGEEALEKIEALSPQIAIVDINMPKMNGIELIKSIYEKGYTCKIVVLSCHDDFKYVKEALKLGAEDYILKHMLKPDQLLKVLNTVKQKIERERVEKYQYQGMKMLANEGKTFLKEKFIRQLVEGKLRNIDEVKEKIEELEMKLQLHRTVIFTIEVDQYYQILERYKPNGKALLHFSIVNICEEIVNDFGTGEVSEIKDNQFVIIFDFSKVQSYADIYAVIHKTVYRIQSSINEYLGITVSIGISEVNEGDTHIPLYYKQSNTALKCKFYEGSKCIFYYKDMKKFSDHPETIDKEIEEDFVRFIKNNELVQVERMVDKFFEVFKREWILPTYVYQFCKEVSVIINRIGKQYNLQVEQIYNSSEDPAGIIDKMDLMDDLKQWVKQISIHLAGILTETQIGEIDNHVIKEVIKFIQCNYMNDITLTSIAEHVHMNKTYLSFLFKQETGKNFVEYLKEVRIQNAAEFIIQTDLKVNQIAKKVGIGNRKYFSKLFKEVMGVSPAEYKKKNMYL